MEKDKIEKQIAIEIRKDFLNRQKERKKYERQWQLNLNFLQGKQNCKINSFGEIIDTETQYYWQENQVFNHIAPIIEARISKLSTLKPTIAVSPASSSNLDIGTAKMSTKILKSVQERLSLGDKIIKCINYSEIFGTGFYKICWDSSQGKTIGFDSESIEIKEGDVDITVCSPFEIYVENNDIENLEKQPSLIYAKLVPVDEIKKVYKVDVKPDDNTNEYELFSKYNGDYVNKTLSNSALVLEKYILPNNEYENGRLIIVCQDRVLVDDVLPYINTVTGERGYPFIKQCSIANPNCFWGSSIIERLIPVQRAYNSVKNRKHEFLNRMAVGTIAVEDGSIDVDDLQEEGLCPGKVLVYRQGSNIPQMLDNTAVPSEFAVEEDKLLNEFTIISGMSDMLLNNEVNGTLLSGTALNIISEQESERLNISAKGIKSAVVSLGKHILYLYKQFITSSRFRIKSTNYSNNEVYYWNLSDITTDDIIVETKTDLGESLTQKREMIFKLLENNLLYDEDGKMSNQMRIRVLQMLGFGSFECRVDLTELQMKKASRENVKMLNGQSVNIDEIDDDELHLAEHTAYALSEEFENLSENIRQLFYKHILLHKENLKSKSANIDENLQKQTAKSI